MSQEAANAIQCAIQEEARLWGEESFYSPSPGQTWSHVANRIARVVSEVLEESGGTELHEDDELVPGQVQEQPLESEPLPHPELDPMDFLNQLIAAEDDILLVYPCVIAPARYGGIYEGGQWAAFGAREVPDGAVSSDVECSQWWINPTCLVGVGRNPGEAYERLVAAFRACRHLETKALGHRDVNNKIMIECCACRQVVDRIDSPTDMPRNLSVEEFAARFGITPDEIEGQ